MHKVVRTVGFAASRISVAAAVVVMVIVLVGAVILYTRYHERRLNEGAVDAPAAPSVAWGEEAPPRTGRFEASLSFTDLAVSHELVQDIVWDDGWFFQDSETYDPELARACSVIAALAYSESGYYQQGSSQPAYMEQALAELGFTDVSTDSYRYRSEVVDEALSLVTDESDGAAYAVATKRIEPDSGSAQVGAAAAAGSDGAGAESASGDSSASLSGAASSSEAAADGSAAESRAKTLVLVSIRGSYGSEWLSNLAVLGEDGSRSAADSAASGASPSSVDTAPSDDGHPGYTEAAREVREAVDARIRSAHAAGYEVEVLLVGHSRGGAIANLVAASALDDLAAVRDGSAPQSLPSLRAGDRVRAYTFASPGTTTASDAGDARYGSIFNIVNPADIMVSLPPSSWGYERYGRDMELPSVHDVDFGARFDAMGVAFESMMGIPCIYNPDNELSIDAALGDLSGQVGSAEELKTPAGVIALLSACMARIDPVAVLQGHYPSVYIAWMTSLEADTAWA